MPFVFRWILNAVYFAIIFAVSPFLIYRRWTQGKYRRGWNEKLTGRIQRQRPQDRCIWLHAVSVGEVVQLQRLIEGFERQFPDAEVLITTTTETGFDVARNKYPNNTVRFFPLDFSWAVKNALSSIRPDLIVLVELELWPNFIFTARQLQIPVALVNGRISQNSFRGYCRIRPLMQRLLKNIDLLLVQNETFAERLRQLGASAERVIVSGNIKYDRVETDRANNKTQAIRSQFGLQHDEIILIAGSTQDPEEQYALDVWDELSKKFSHLRLIIVPRHKERFEEVASAIQHRGFDLLRRSSIQRDGISAAETHRSTARRPVCLLDTLGELAACWGIADIAFVGGSLTNRGGQNMIEPAGFGAAVLFGPNTWNFQDIAESLLSLNAAKVVRGPAEFRATVLELILDSQQRSGMGQAATQFVVSQKGATERSMKLVSELLIGHEQSRTTVRPSEAA